MEIDLPLVSFVAPAWNSERYIASMLESVLHQTYPKVELFVQDGGSTDSTLSILDRYPVRWASAPDSGISQALNRAIAATTGKIVGFMSSDDLPESHAARIAVDAFRSYPEVVMVYGDCMLIDNSDRPFRLWKSRPFDLDDLFWGTYIPYQTAYVKREALASVGGFDESLKLVQDLDLWLRLGLAFPPTSFRYVPRVLGRYRFVPGTAGFRNPGERVKCVVRVAEKCLSCPSAGESETW